MPILNLSLKDVEHLMGKKLPTTEDELNDFFQYVGGEVENLEGDELQLEIKCRNRHKTIKTERTNFPLILKVRKRILTHRYHFNTKFIKFIQAIIKTNRATAEKR